MSMKLRERIRSTYSEGGYWWGYIVTFDDNVIFGADFGMVFFRSFPDVSGWPPTVKTSLVVQHNFILYQDSTYEVFMVS